MARSRRGSRAITVDGMNYRWRAGDGEISVWHVLDAGLLRVTTPPEVRWNFTPEPAYVARVIRMGLGRGWRTLEHFHLGLNVHQFAVAVDYRAPSRLLLQEFVDPVDRQIALMRLPSLQGEVRLRVTLLPAEEGGVVFDLTTSGKGSITLHGMVKGQLEHVTEPCDPDWIRDIVVDIKECDSPAVDGLNGVRGVVDPVVGGVTAGLDLCEPGGELRWRGRVEDAVLQSAAQGAWRVAWQAFSGADRVTLERMHPVLKLNEDPWLVQKNRLVRLFGVLSADRIDRFLEVIGSGGWVVDARNLRKITPEARDRLHQVRDLAEVWVASEPHGLERTWERSLEGARQRIPRLVRTVMARRLALGIDPRWISQVSETLQRGGSLTALERWLGQGWHEVSAPTQAVWFDGRSVRTQQPEGAWLALNSSGLVVGLPGRCVAFAGKTA